ncbi:MAG TPA: phage holin family protein [Natronosporangium sp.]
MTSVNGSANGRSTAELVQQASEQVSRLVRDELTLAKAELAEKGRHAGVGVGLFGGSGVVVMYALGALIIAAIAGLAEALPTWLSALIIGVALLLIAGVMVLLGRRQVKQAVPPMPKEATDGVRADLAALKTAVRERGHS